MRCRICRHTLPEGARYCKRCGAKAVMEEDNRFYNEQEDKAPREKQPDYAATVAEPAPPVQPRGKKLQLVVAAVAVVVVLAFGVFWGLMRGTAQDEPRQSAGAELEMPEQQAEQSDETQPDDYSKVLEPGEFIRYTGTQPSFAFSYPKDFYTSEQVSEDGSSVLLDTRESSAHFTCEARTDGSTLTDCYEQLYREHEAALYSAETVYAKPKTPSGARFIVTGYADAACTVAVYDLVYITDMNVMEMRVVYPPVTGAEDKNQKWYYVECLYRMCEFSGSSRAPRTYEQYLKGEN